MRGTAGIEPAASTGQRSPHHRDSGEHHDADRRPTADITASRHHQIALAAA